MSMSADDTPPPPPSAGTPPRSRRPQAAAPSTDKPEAQVQATVPQDLKDLIKARAEHEERTEAVIVRRALQAYMKGWEPTEENR
jgi:hypothetical protein